MDEIHRAQVRNCNSTLQVMSRLEKLYGDKSASNIFRLLYKFYQYKKLETDGIADHYSKLESMRRALESLGEKQSEKVFQVMLISSLPSEYSNILEFWEITAETERTTENLLSRLRKREEDLSNNISTNSAFLTKTRVDRNSLPIEGRKRRSLGCRMSIETQEQFL